MSGEFDTQDPRYTGLYIGVVIARKDPLGIGRIKARIPGLLDSSPWAFPLGTVGGGSDRRGFFSVPEIGAEVGILFNQGDPDHPWYLGAHWGKPGGSKEVPEPAKETDRTETPDVRAFETPKYLLVFDDREGKESLYVRDKLTGDQIEFDGVGQGITIQATSALILKAVGLLTIDAPVVSIKGRVVQPSDKPI